MDYLEDKKLIEQVKIAITQNKTEEGQISAVLSIIDKRDDEIDKLKSENKRIKNYVIDLHVIGTEECGLSEKAKEYRKELKS
jgi:hypothetical protein